MRDYLKSISTEGFAIVPDLLDEEIVSSLQLAIESLPESHGVKRRKDHKYGVRNLLNMVPAIRSLAGHECIRELVDPVLGTKAKPVKGIFMDKTPDANWKVAWHQDRIISVKRRIDVGGFGGWSNKAGICHVQP